jgi:hypothetical protein
MRPALCWSVGGVPGEGAGLVLLEVGVVSWIRHMRSSAPEVRGFYRR